MTTGADTLPEFLTARIAEEETYWRTARSGPGRDPDTGKLLVMRGRVGASWMLRECASRRIIAEIHAIPHQCISRDETSAWVDFGQACATLQILALPYVGHPGFQPGWRLS